MILETIKMIGRRGANHELPATRHPEEVNGLEETVKTEPELFPSWPSKPRRFGPATC